MAITKRSCKAVNQKGKCVLYTAKHTTAKAATAHAKKICTRGGTVKRTNTGNTITLSYSFPKNKK